MQWLYDVHGDHPIGKRVDESQLTEVEKNDLVAELKKLNYENIEVNKDIYFEDGDQIDITSHEYLNNNNKEGESLLFSVIMSKARNLGIHDLGSDTGYDANKLEEAYIYQLCPLRLTLKSVRADRQNIYLQAEWDIGNGKIHTTNIYGLRKMGYKFITSSYSYRILMRYRTKYQKKKHE